MYEVWNDKNWDNDKTVYYIETIAEVGAFISEKAFPFNKDDIIENLSNGKEYSYMGWIAEKRG